jgi:tetratricopeptide (TPR) repeat protein
VRVVAESVSLVAREPTTMALAEAYPNSQPAGATAAETDELLSRAIAFHRAGMLTEAEELYRKVLAADPEHFDSLHLLGVLAYQRGNYSDAVRQIDTALRLNPDVADAYNNRGNALKKMGRFEEARASYDRAIALKSDDAASYNNRGSVLKDLKRFDEATADFERAIALKPDFAEAFNNRGNVAFELKRFENALADYNEAIARKVNNFDAYNNRGNALKELDRSEEALASYDQALRLKPDYAQAFYNRGTTLYNLRRLEEALPDLNEAIRLNPAHAEAFYNRAMVLRDLHRIDDALADFDRAISLKPDYTDALWNRGMCRLLAGRYREGWPDYEWRWHTAQMVSSRRPFRQRQWGGKTDILGKTILLHSEQGYGDTIMAARYIRRVVESGARVILDVPIAVVPLIERIEGVAATLSKGQFLPAFDLHCPMMSLPGVFETTLETIPDDVPYLSVPGAYAEKWAQRLPKRGLPRLGISWGGNPEFKYDTERSIGLRPMLPLLQRADAQYFSVQKDLREGDAEILRVNQQVTPLGDAIENFADTAAIIASLDLIITSDTAVAHLAGALGKPVWVLLQFTPDWRWLLDRDDSPWYPTVRLFRQPHRDDWNAVIADVGRALDIFLAR